MRGAAYAGRITLVSDETVPPYDKPPLSKGLLAGTTSVEDLALLTPAEADKLGMLSRVARRSPWRLRQASPPPSDTVPCSTDAQAQRH